MIDNETMPICIDSISDLELAQLENWIRFSMAEFLKEGSKDESAGSSGG